MPIQFDFHGRTALVTGVARTGQIGHAVARALAAAGAGVVLADLNAVEVAARATEFRADGLRAVPAAGDLTRADTAAFAVRRAVEEFGGLDLVVNVAGGLTTWGPIAGLTPEALERELAINLKTAVLVSQAALPALAGRGGAIVNFASVAYYRPQDQLAAYAAAKAAVAGFTQSLAREVRDTGVRVNAVAPAMVRTADNVATAGPEARFVEMEDIVHAVLFLASDGARAITGHVLPVTNGDL
ncbi:MAG TPA: SDR family oxidoreductase [Gemmatimonadales bacterium]|nr:SDR family oxidoreductase [Gemmatimonadales bacterium]